MRICTFRDLYNEDTFSSFASLCSRFNLPRTYMIRYFQVHHCAQTLFVPFPGRPPDLAWEKFFALPVNSRGIISLIYNSILSLTDRPLTNRSGWELELGGGLNEDWWSKTLKKIIPRPVLVWIWYSSNWSIEHIFAMLDWLAFTQG